MKSLAKGSWAKGITWEAFGGIDHMPSMGSVTATGIVFFNGKIGLTKHYVRGWEFPGGHIESGETPQETFIREMQEELGVDIKNITYIGYKKLQNDVGTINKSTGRPYPRQSYDVWYTADALSDAGAHVLVDDAIDSGFFDIKNEFIQESDDVCFLNYLLGK